MIREINGILGGGLLKPFCGLFLQSCLSSCPLLSSNSMVRSSDIQWVDVVWDDGLFWQETIDLFDDGLLTRVQIIGMGHQKNRQAGIFHRAICRVVTYTS